jgi:hypothetical protein
MRLRFKYNVGRWIMGRFRGKVLYPFVLFKQARDEVSDILFRHEMEHVYQVKRLGWFGFYGRYLWYMIKYAYKTNPFEIEANERENDPLTDEERKLKLGEGDALSQRSRKSNWW